MYHEQVRYIQSKSNEVENHKKAVENDRRILDISIKESSDVQVLLESRKLQNQLENHKRLLTQISTTCCDCTLQFKISGNVDEILNMIDEHIKISCDTSSCNIAFKSVVEDCSDRDTKWMEDIICTSEFDYLLNDIICLKGETIKIGPQKQKHSGYTCTQKEKVGSAYYKYQEADKVCSKVEPIEIDWQKQKHSGYTCTQKEKVGSSDLKFQEADKVCSKDEPIEIDRQKQKHSGYTCTQKEKVGSSDLKFQEADKVCSKDEPIEIDRQKQKHSGYTCTQKEKVDSSYFKYQEADKVCSKDEPIIIYPQKQKRSGYTCPQKQKASSEEKSHYWDKR